jgi:hypothetical protein
MPRTLPARLRQRGITQAVWNRLTPEQQRDVTRQSDQIRQAGRTRTIQAGENQHQVLRFRSLDNAIAYAVSLGRGVLSYIIGHGTYRNPDMYGAADGWASLSSWGSSTSYPARREGIKAEDVRIFVPKSRSYDVRSRRRK